MESIKHLVKGWLKGWVMTIRSGPLEGFSWIASSGRKFIEGKYEPYKTKAFVAQINPGDCVIDVGAHVGYYSAIASRLAGKEGRVFSFEPRPLNLGFLNKHIEITHLENVRIFEAGVSNYTGKARFDARTGTGTGHLDQAGELEVDVVALDEPYENGELPRPDFLKIDVEGGELEVLDGAERLIQSCRPKILVAVHCEATFQGTKEFLERLDYEMEILNPDAVRGDTEIMALPR